jgi:hypothetical protein
VACDLNAIFNRGGKRLIDFLDYSVRSAQMDALFVFLVGEYQRNPTNVRAVTLYDFFCAPGAPARVSAEEFLPPRNLQLEMSLRRARVHWMQRQTFLPPTFLQGASTELRRIRRQYRVRRTPFENLPGGTMTAGQRRFVDQVWQPRLRPGLVAAGFRQVTAIA